jgi:hypothetical protein
MEENKAHPPTRQAQGRMRSGGRRKEENGGEQGSLSH